MKKMRKMRKMRKKSGITLIALVITIIVLLILAGVSLSLVMGNEGILGKATNTVEKNAKGRAEEEIKLVLNEWRIEKVLNRTTFLAFLEEKVQNKEIDDYEEIEEEKIEIRRNGYGLIVDLDGNIVEGIQKVGPRPTISNIRITLEDGTEPEDYSQPLGTPLTIDFDVMIEGGEITKIEPEKPYVTDGNEEKVTFKIIGVVNGEEYSKTSKISVSNKYMKTYESMQKAVEGMNEDGIRKIQIAAQDEVVLHGIDAIVHHGDLVLDGTNEVKGASLLAEEKTYEFGEATKDVATENTEAQNTVVLKVEGNLTIHEGVTLTACKSEDGYGGPKGLIIYCTGNLTNKGEISMTARGAKAEGQNVYLLKNADGTYEYVPAEGANGVGGVSVTTDKANTSVSEKGRPGTNGTDRQTGGGGSGGASFSVSQGDTFVVRSGSGAQGTSYSGGSGGGTGYGNSYAYSWSNTNWKSETQGQSGERFGGSGGDGRPTGAGNPGSQSGTGGLLVIFAQNLNNENKIYAKGQDSGAGASGGGSINVFANVIQNEGEMDTTGGYGNGNGGNGSVTVQSVELSLK